MRNIERSPRLANRTMFTFCAVLLFLALVPSRLAGQAVGTIHGLVSDPEGAVVPSATITAKQTGTGFIRGAAFLERCTTGQQQPDSSGKFGHQFHGSVFLGSTHDLERYYGDDRPRQPRA